MPIVQFTGQSFRAFPHILILKIGKNQVLILGHHSTMDLFAILVSFEEASLLELFAFFVGEAVVDAAAQPETLFRPGF